MSRILLRVTHIETESGVDSANKARVEWVINDHTQNVDHHLRLLGMLAKSTLILSDDTGILTVEIRKEDTKENNA